MQVRVLDRPPQMFLGQFTSPAGFRSNLHGVIAIGLHEIQQDQPGMTAKGKLDKLLASENEDRHIVALATRRSVRMSKTNLSKFEIAPVRSNINASDCLFYHTLDIPGFGEVKGQWDLRGNENDYIGGVPLHGKTVLEIGPASGYMTFWMERAGATVTAFDLSEDHKWDFVPFRTGCDMNAFNATRRTDLQRLHNSWWFTRQAYEAGAEMVYGTVYDIDSSLGSFEIVTMNSVLIHLRDTFRAIEKAASVCSKKIVVSDVAEEHFLAARPDLWGNMCMYFLPRFETKTPMDSWYYTPSALIAEIFKILGFDTVTITKHSQNFMTGPWKFYTVVGERL